MIAVKPKTILVRQKPVQKPGIMAQKYLHKEFQKALIDTKLWTPKPICERVDCNDPKWVLRATQSQRSIFQ